MGRRAYAVIGLVMWFGTVGIARAESPCSQALHALAGLNSYEGTLSRPGGDTTWTFDIEKPRSYLERRTNRFGTSELLAIGGDAWQRRAGGTWYALPSGMPLDRIAPMDPFKLTTFTETSCEAAGTTVRSGERLRVLRASYVSGSATSTETIWLAPSGHVVRMESSGTTGPWVAEFSRFDAVTIAAP